MNTPLLSPSKRRVKKPLSRYLTPGGLRHHGDLVGLIDGNDAHILVSLLLRQSHILRAVNVAEPVDLKKLVWPVHHVLIDDRLGRLGALPAQQTKNTATTRLRI